MCQTLAVSEPIVPLERILAAREAVAARVHRTPMLSSATAARIVSAATGIQVADRRLYLKAEHLQKTCSFKPAGQAAKVAALTSDERQRGIVTLSAGNAGQAYAWAGGQAGVPTVVVMPAAAVRSKVEACLGYGAEVVLYSSRRRDVCPDGAIRDERG